MKLSQRKERNLQLQKLLLELKYGGFWEMHKEEIERDVNKVAKRISEAIGGIEKAKEVKENSTKHKFIKHE